MHILIAPDKFKGSLPATRVADAMTRGARKIHPEASFSVRPIADGGEGTLDAFISAMGGRVRDIVVPGPLGDPVGARIANLNDGRSVIEMSEAAGLDLVHASPGSASRAHTGGVGRLMLEAHRHGASTLVVGVGGSASTDGGSGAATQFGWRFLDGDGEVLEPGGAPLNNLVRIEPPDPLPSIEIIGACDVDNALTGPRGAARVFAPQKGADSETVARLERGLERLAEIVRADLGLAIADIAHGGAGGGLAAGLIAFFGASLRPGLEFLADSTGLSAEIEAADLVITGEGRMDLSSLSGKAPVAVAEMARRLRTPCVAISGDMQLDRQHLKQVGISDGVGLIQSGAGDLAVSDPERAIERATEGLLRMRQERNQGRSLRRHRSFRG